MAQSQEDFSDSLMAQIEKMSIEQTHLFNEKEFRVRSEMRMRTLSLTLVAFSGLILITSSVFLFFKQSNNDSAAIALLVSGTFLQITTFSSLFLRNSVNRIYDRYDQDKEENFEQMIRSRPVSSRARYFEEIHSKFDE